MTTLYLADSVRVGVSPNKTVQARVQRFEPTAERQENGGWIGRSFGGSTVGSFVTFEGAVAAVAEGLKHRGWTEDYEQAKRDANAQAQARAKPSTPAVLLAFPGRPSEGKDARVTMRWQPDIKAKAERCAAAAGVSMTDWVARLVMRAPDA